MLRTRSPEAPTRTDFKNCPKLRAVPENLPAQGVLTAAFVQENGVGMYTGAAIRCNNVDRI